MPDNEFPKLKPHPAKMAANGAKPGRAERVASGVAYAELSVTSNYTFLTGGSFPEELVERAGKLGHAAVAITDTNTLAGIVRAHVAAKQHGVRLVVGCRVALADGPPVLVYPTDRAAYARLCRLLTLGKRRAPKGECHLWLDDLLAHQEGLLGVVELPSDAEVPSDDVLGRLRDAFDDDRLSLAAAFGHDGNDAERIDRLVARSNAFGVPIVATNRVLYHDPSRRALQDVLTCIRHGCTIEQAGFRLAANAERHLKPPEEMARLFAALPRAVARSAAIAERAAFGLDELRYEYPAEACPAGMSATAYLEQQSWAGARRRYGGEPPAKTAAALRHELALIAELKYEAYFLTCFDIVNFARSRGILCQGRGGAANSAVCYCLGITEVDPATHSLLFERFISRERGEPPDIDIDFEHERREEVIQYLYGKYGRDRAALTAEVISYRGRSAVREVAKAMGLSRDCIDAMAKNLDRWGEAASDERVREIGLNPRDPTIRRVIELTGQLIGFPRHLSQHVGGFVITRTALSELVPVENAAMEDRTVIEWDKDDIDAMGMLKVDCLGLGMLTVLRKGLGFILGYGGRGGLAETERRRDGETECGGTGVVGWFGVQGACDGWGEELSGSGGLATGDGAGARDVPGDGGDAGFGTVRADEPDAPGGGVGAVEHRGGIRAREPGGPVEISAYRSGLAERGLDPVRTGGVAGHDRPEQHAHRSHRRDRSCIAGVDPQPDDGGTLTPDRTSSLRLSVSGSPDVYPLYASVARSLTDPAVYDMICAADTVGVFQIESRAQMSMLPRLRPRCFYDLVIEVAIVRPGPIQGGMVHPYLRRREGVEAVSYPSAAVKEVLGRTLGVPLFQEQAMQLAIVAAGFTADQADGLRRSMAAWKRKGDAIYRYGQQLIEGMIANGYPPEFAERCFEQIKGFSEYGFPESHAASFAILVYVSAWMKRHHPAAFAAALINSQPMGFYAPAQIVRDAKEHGVEVRGVDVNRSGWECQLEERDGETERRRDGVGDGLETWGVRGPVLRLGMRLVKGLSEVDARKVEGVVAERGAFGTIESLWRASGVSVRALKALARADAFGSMGLDRQRASWQIRALRDTPMPLFDGVDGTDDAGLDCLPEIPAPRRVLHDYDATGLSLKAHPVSFFRGDLEAKGVVSAGELRDARRFPAKTRVRVAGVVLCRQRPGTASGVVFITLEDETGIANLIVWSDTFEKYRRVARLSTAMIVTGTVERQGEVVHVHAAALESADGYLPELVVAARDFH